MGADLLITALMVDERSQPDFAVLRADLRVLHDAISGCREVAEMIVHDARLYLTGGMSWREGPTEVWDVIARLRAVRGVLAAAGFEGEE